MYYQKNISNFSAPLKEKFNILANDILFCSELDEEIESAFILCKLNL